MSQDKIKEWLKDRALCGTGTISGEILDYINLLESELDRVKAEPILRYLTNTEVRE